VDHPLDNRHSFYSAHYGTPHLMGLKFRAWCPGKRPAWQERYLVEFPTDCMNQDYELTTRIMMDILDNIMKWWDLRSIRFVCSRSRSCDSSWPDGRDGCVKMVRQLDGWCDMYEKKLERSR